MFSSFLSDESDNCRLCNLQTRAKAAVVKKLEFTRTLIALITFFQRFWYFWFLSSNLFLGLDLFFIGFFVFLILVFFTLIGLLSFTLFLLWLLLILTAGSLKMFANQITIFNIFAICRFYIISIFFTFSKIWWWVYLAIIFILSICYQQTWVPHLQFFFCVSSWPSPEWVHCSKYFSQEISMVIFNKTSSFQHWPLQPYKGEHLWEIEVQI